jgi:hypothetical protein
VLPGAEVHFGLVVARRVIVPLVNDQPPVHPGLDPVVSQGEEAVRVGSEGGLPLVGGPVTLLVLPMLGVLRRRGGPADIIIGTAGRQGVCAAQGLPDVASVDATPRQAV